VLISKEDPNVSGPITKKLAELYNRDERSLSSGVIPDPRDRNAQPLCFSFGPISSEKSSSTGVTVLLRVFNVKQPPRK
jgi:hypothetical protein